jgi:hypothetical protein
VEHIRFALQGILPPIAVALLLVGVFGARLAALALGIGTFVAFGLVKRDWPEWPWLLWSGNNDGMQWLAWCILSAGVLGAVQDLRWLGKKVPVALDVAGVIAVPLLMTMRMRSRWSFEESLVHLVIGWTLLGGLWFVLRGTAQKRPGWAIPAVWTACLIGDSIVLLESGSAFQGQLAGAAAAALGAAVFTATWRKPFALGPGAAMAVAVAHFGLLYAGYHFSELPRWPALLAFAAPLPLGFATWRYFDDEPKFGVLVGVVAAAVMLGIAVANAS